MDPAQAVLHDPRLGVGEVVLILGARAGRGRFGWAPAGLAPLPSHALLPLHTNKCIICGVLEQFNGLKPLKRSASSHGGS